MWLRASHRPSAKTAYASEMTKSRPGPQRETRTQWVGDSGSADRLSCRHAPDPASSYRCRASTRPTESSTD